MKDKLIWLLIKSFGKNKKFVCYISSVIFFSTIILNVLFQSLILTGDYLRENAEKNYGSFNYLITNIEKEKAENIISNEESIARAALVQEMIDDNDFYIACDETYIKITDIKLIDGEFPEKYNEVLCNINYMLQLNYTYEEMVGAEISVKGEKYIVTGLIESQSLREIEFTGGVFVFNSSFMKFDCTYNLYVENTKDNYYSDKKTILKKYDISPQKCVDNGNVLNFAQKDDRNLPKRMLLSGYFVFAFICICMMTLINSVFIFALDRTKKMNKVYMLMGISKNQISKAYMIVLLFIYSISIMTSLVFYCNFINHFINYKMIEYFKIVLLFNVLWFILNLALNFIVICKFLFLKRTKNSLNCKKR